MSGRGRAAERSALPSPPGSGRWYISPSYSSRSPRAMSRTISIISRMRCTGRSNGTPCQPSTTCGPLAPSPRMKRSSDIDGEAHRRHRHVRRRARARLHDPGAEPDARRAGGQEGERRDGVVPPGLRRPDVVRAEPLGLHHVGARRGPVLVGEPQRDGDAHGLRQRGGDLPELFRRGPCRAAGGTGATPASRAGRTRDAGSCGRGARRDRRRSPARRAPTGRVPARRTRPGRSGAALPRGSYARGAERGPRPR